ncbi:hypothetical protein AB0B66_09235 [Catellatospora sp. NPDC049111]|uniref:hypothetical protein n=1 Tax=Catellatospora sp. NPDC049111 TaxID=3155271 RepID=UPI0033F58600
MSQLPAQPASTDPDARPTALPDQDGVSTPAVPAPRRGTLRWVIAGGAALLVAAVTVGAVRLGGAATGPAAPSPGTGPADLQIAAADPPVAPIAFTATPPTEAPVSFDPLVRIARFGRLPAGMVPRTTIVQAGEQGGYTIEAGLPNRSIGAQVAVTFFPRGAAPHRACLPGTNLVRTGPGTTPAPAGTPAPSLYGKPAKLVDGRLRWEYAPGAWAEAVGKDLAERAGDDPAANLPALAEIVRDLRYGVESLRFPVVLGGVPKGLPLAAASVTERSKTGWSSVLVFTAEPYCGGEHPFPQSTLSLRAEAIVPGYGWTGDQGNTTIDGHRAFKQEMPTGGAELAVYDNPGPFVALATSDAETTRLAGGDGLVNLYRRVQVLGTSNLAGLAEPADQSGWTTDPVR